MVGVTIANQLLSYWQPAPGAQWMDRGGVDHYTQHRWRHIYVARYCDVCVAGSWPGDIHHGLVPVRVSRQTTLFKGSYHSIPQYSDLTQLDKSEIRQRTTTSTHRFALNRCLSYNSPMLNRHTQQLKTRPLCGWILSAAIMALATLAVPTDVIADDTANATGSSAADKANSVEGVSEQIQQTDTLLKQLQQDIASSRLQKQKIVDSLSAVQGNVSERTQRLKQLNKEIAQYDSELDSLSSSIAEQERGIEKRKSLLADSLRKSQRVNTASGLKVVLQHDDPVLADRLGIYTEYFMAAQDTAIKQQLAALTLIEDAHLEAVKNRNWLNHIKKKAQKQHDNFAANARAQKTELKTVENQLTEKQRSVAQLKADQARLQILLEELKAAQVAKSGYFLAGKGKYPLPVDGQLQARFGEMKSVGKIRWQGLFIAARSGTPVGAIADGEVIYSDWLQGFGNLVILDHGDAFMTLYGGNRDVRIKKGDWVDSGSTIATVGNSGGQSANGVYFEIRHNAIPVDPAGWVDATISINSARK